MQATRVSPTEIEERFARQWAALDAAHDEQMARFAAGIAHMVAPAFKNGVQQ